MEADWYYAEGGETIGPVSLRHVVAWIEQTRGASHLVWTKGMPEWVEADALSDFSAAFESSPSIQYDDDTTTIAEGGDEKVDDDARLVSRADDAEPASSPKPTLVQRLSALAQRARTELAEYLWICLYLYVCLGALILYKTSILHSVGIPYAAYGVAILKALVLGKFILILQSLKIGERRTREATVLTRIAMKSLLFAILLFVLTVIEEIVVGYFRSQSSRAALSDSSGGMFETALAVGVLLLLILIPYFAFREINDNLGEGGLLKLLRERRSPEPSDSEAGDDRDRSLPPT